MILPKVYRELSHFKFFWNIWEKQVKLPQGQLQRNKNIIKEMHLLQIRLQTTLRDFSEVIKDNKITKTKHNLRNKNRILKKNRLKAQESKESKMNKIMKEVVEMNNR